MPGGDATVAGHHDDPDVLLVELPDGFWCRLLDRVGHANQSSEHTVYDHEHHRLALLAPIVGAGNDIA